MLIKLIGSLSLIVSLSFWTSFNDEQFAFGEGDYIVEFTLAEKWDVKAQFNLVLIYYNDKGVIKDYKKTKEFFGKACDGGYQKGCDNYKILNQQGY